MTRLQAAATHYRIAQGPRAGQKVLSLQLAPRHLARSGESRATLCANAHGFSLHAGVRIAADDRRGLEQRACECYAVVKREYDRLLPDTVHPKAAPHGPLADDCRQCSV